MIPPLNYVTWTLLILLFLVIARATHLRGILLRYRKYYFVFSYISLVILTILVFGALDYSGNPVFWRAYANGNAHHTLTWFAVFIILYRFGYKEVLKGLGAAGGFVVIHEALSITMWLITGNYGKNIGLFDALFYYSTFFFLLGATFVFYLYFAKKTWGALLKTSFIMLIMFTVWASIGGMSTIDLNGATQYFYSYDVNLLEIFSWLIPSIYFAYQKV